LVALRRGNAEEMHPDAFLLRKNHTDPNVFVSTH
jgi:hypothetical protein